MRHFQMQANMAKFTLPNDMQEFSNSLKYICKIVLIGFSVCLINVNLACSNLSLVPGPLLQKAPDPGPILAGMYVHI